MKSKLRPLLVLITSVLLCGSALAQDENFYVEGYAGFSSIKVTTGGFLENNFTLQLPASTLPPGTPTLNTVTINSIDKSDTAFGLRVGYQMLPYVSFEVNFVDAGFARVKGFGTMYTPTTSTPAVGTPTIVNFSTMMHIQNWSGGPAFRYTFADRFTVIGRIGMEASTAKWQTNATSTFIPPNQSSQTADKIFRDALRKKEKHADINYGIALNFKINDHLAAGGSYDQHTGRQAAKVIAGNFRYTF